MKVESRQKFSLSRFRQLFFTLSHSIRLAAKIDRRLLIAVLLLNSFWGLTSLPVFYTDKLLIDTLVKGVGNLGWRIVFQTLIVLLLVRVVLELLRNLISSLSSFLRFMLSRKVTNEIDVLMGEKISRLDLATIESPEFRDKFSKIERESGRRLWGLMMPVSDIPNYLVGMISSLGILFFFAPWVALGIFIFSLPSFFINRKFIKKEYLLNTELSPLYRIWGWLSYYLVQNRNFMEMKILNLSSYIGRKLRNLQNTEHKKRVDLGVERQKIELLSLFPVSFFDFAATLWAGYMVLLGRITVGSFQMFLRAVSSFQQNLGGLINSFLEIYENYVYVLDLIWFFDLPSGVEKEGGKVFSGLFDEVVFDNVWFKYQDDSDWIIRGVSFKIEKGEKIALVGRNGAGKSTLVKILGGFYIPQKGKVLVDGTNLFDFDLSSWRKKMAVLFQDFELYPFSAKEAIGFGDVERLNDLGGIKRAAQKAGVSDFIESLPLGYDNPIAPEFEKGVKPSIGQWQRFGIARVFFRKDACILVLDEPTSNVDPEMEEKIFEEVAKITKDKALLFITQRFSTIRIADRILVLEKGKIVEEGSHKKLLAKNGQYAKMFNLQARAYNFPE